MPGAPKPASTLAALAQIVLGCATEASHFDLAAAVRPPPRKRWRRVAGGFPLKGWAGAPTRQGVGPAPDHSFGCRALIRETLEERLP